MDILVFLLLVIILLLVVSHRNNFKEQMDLLQREIKKLTEQVRTLQMPRPPESPVTEMTAPLPGVLRTIEKAIQPPVAQQEEMEQPYWESGFRRMEEEVVEPVSMFDEAATPPPSTPEPLAPVHEPAPGFFERHPDLEKFIGENLISKIGIGILVIAIGFFVKYAIDQQWIGPAARVGIGILCGAILIGLAHYMRNSYKAFSSVLTGGGLAVFYFSITLAYQQFHLFSQTAAFLVLVIITAFSVALSLLYDKQDVAIIAVVGGFATPFMASNGSGNYILSDWDFDCHAEGGREALPYKPPTIG